MPLCTGEFRKMQRGRCVRYWAGMILPLFAASGSVVKGYDKREFTLRSCKVWRSSGFGHCRQWIFYNMVRIIAGTLIDIGRGKLQTDAFSQDAFGQRNAFRAESRRRRKDWSLQRAYITARHRSLRNSICAKKAV